MDCAKVGKLILQLRIEKGLTQKQVADRLNITNKTISKWECGLGCPDVSLWEELANVLGADILKLLQGELTPNRPDVGKMDRIQFYVCPTCGIPSNQSVAIEWKTVTRKTFENQLKKWNATVTKRDGETGSAQGDASLAGATYGVYQGDTLIDTYTTDAAGQFTTDYYPCGDDWSIREITPSEGCLLDSASHHVGAEPRHYTAEYNSISMDVTEQVIKGSIAIIKHTDNGETQLETPEAGAEFAVYLKSSGSYDGAKASERDYGR